MTMRIRISGNVRVIGIVLLLSVGAGACLFGQDPLRQSLENRLQTIAAESDAVVGISVKNFTTGETYAMNANEVFPQASSIKIHILTELYRQVAQGKCKLDEQRPFSEASRVGGSGILAMLGKQSVSMSLRDYAVLMMVLSDNSATNLLIDLLGMENINASLEKLGAHATRLQRVMMDYEAAKAGRENVGTPAEVLMVLEKMVRGEIVNRAACDDMLAIMSLEKDGPLKAGLPAGIPIANKEGDVEGVHTDCGIITLDNQTYGICVMVKLLPDDRRGAAIITSVSEVVYKYMERKAHSNKYGRRIPR